MTRLVEEILRNMRLEEEERKAIGVEVLNPPGHSTYKDKTLEEASHESLVIKNLKGTGALKCRCGSWIKHWDNFAKRSVGNCAVLRCTEKATDGAHVKKSGPADPKHYIIPLCHQHNISNESHKVLNSTEFVPANTKETCRKNG